MLNASIISETIELSSDGDYTKLVISQLQKEVDERYLNRLNKWLQFFNENHLNCICYYNVTIEALLNAVKSNQLFRSQTTLEFNTSLSFYDTIFNSKLFINYCENEAATYLLSMSLVYGKFPGMKLKSLPDQLMKLKNNIDVASLENLFNQLYSKYHTPVIFIKHLPLLNSLEVEVMMHINLGKNISKFPKLPLEMSKKEAYLFIEKLPKNLSFEENILKKAIVCSKLLKSKNACSIYLQSFIEACKTFKYGLDQFIKDIEFWSKAYEIICKARNDERFELINIQAFVDFFEYKKYIEENYSLKGRTVNSIFNAIANWHEKAKYQEELNKINKIWKGSNAIDFKIKHKGEKYKINEITNGIELFKESTELKHCVYSYISYCISGYTTIWSLKKEIDNIYCSYITIEVEENKVVQVAGIRNRTISKEELEVVKQWAEFRNYTIHESIIGAIEVNENL